MNRFSVTRQLAYSLDETRRALDLGLFVSGLPVATFGRMGAREGHDLKFAYA